MNLNGLVIGEKKVTGIYKIVERVYVPTLAEIRLISREFAQYFPEDLFNDPHDDMRFIAKLGVLAVMRGSPHKGLQRPYFSIDAGLFEISWEALRGKEEKWRVTFIPGEDCTLDFVEAINLGWLSDE
jgi:hypothetical protein